MTGRPERLGELFARAARLSVDDRARIAFWADHEALWSERNLAMQAAQDEARRAGRSKELFAALDAAYLTVARSAGYEGSAGYFDDDRGPRPEWEPAATLAAQAAAAIAVDDLVVQPLWDLLLGPWQRLTKPSRVTLADTD